MKKDRAARGAGRQFISYYRPHRGLFALDMACALMIAAIDLSFPVVSRYAMTSLLPGKQFGVFFAVMGALVLAYLLRGVFEYIVTYWGHTQGVRMEADMRRDLFTHLQKMSFSFFDRHRTGQLMSRMTNDLFEITELAHHGPEDLLISLATILGAFAVMLTISWPLALVLIVLVPVGVAFVLLLRRRMMSASRQLKEKTAGINAGLESSISGARVAKAFTNEDYEVEKFTENNERFKRSKSDFYKSMGIFLSGMGVFTNLFSDAVIAVGGGLIMSGRFDYVGLVTFTLYVGIFLQPIRRLTSFMEAFAAGAAGFSRFRELMAEQPEIADKPGAVELTNIKGRIAFENVSFSYNDHTRVLKDLSLTIEAGKTLALVGPSGGGKTTLCHLIPRFYETDSGRITIDGHDIRDVTLLSLRRNIGIVSQDVFLFAGTVRENIRYGRIDATDEEIIEAAKKAEIHDAIMEMEHGYDTQVGERGVRLSGGQKQRIAIARIFLKNPPILILDEATSALDTVTEARIQQSFEELARGRTTIVIAHRLSTVKNADEIIVIDEDGVVERGTHEQLLQKGGMYAQLYHSQFRE
ncbi:MAG: ABC transporter ATP-binding protein [Christensenellaceae bacterium]|nr:ABC transporter ATP-binding protein [Christensenellaceae bacterium]